MWHFGMHGGKRRGLRTWVLVMLKRKPRNGAELMDEMEGMSQGWWRPSPGSVYPLLEELTKEGLIQRRSDGRYELTAKADEDLGWAGFPFGGPADSRTFESTVREMGHQLSYLEETVASSPEGLEPARAKLEEIRGRIDALLKKPRA
jgi:DNA-binding PadR family transcriptional regulator